MKIMNLDEVSHLKALIYGDSGSGKTTLMGTAQECEKTFPLMVMNARGQPISLRHLNPRPLVLDVENVKDFNMVYTWFKCGQDMEWFAQQKQYKKFAPVLSEYLEDVDADRFGSLGIDSITHVQRLALETIVGGTMPDNPADVPTQTQIQHWGRALSLMTNLADKFFALQVHVIMTALTRRDHIEAMGYSLFAPFLWGQSNLEVPSHAELVGRLMSTATIPIRDERGIERAAQSQGTDVPFNVLYLAGGRDFIAKWQGIPDPPKMMILPTVKKLIDLMV